jgi:hypothetical protein
MPESLSDADIYAQARKRVEAKKGFFVHLIIYAVINALIFVIWFITMGGHGYPWFIWPMIGWGIGVLFNFLAVFFFDRETDWERREVEKEAARLRGGPPK